MVVMWGTKKRESVLNVRESLATMRFMWDWKRSCKIWYIYVTIWKMHMAKTIVLGLQCLSLIASNKSMISDTLKGKTDTYASRSKCPKYKRRPWCRFLYRLLLLGSHWTWFRQPIVKKRQFEPCSTKYDVKCTDTKDEGHHWPTGRNNQRSLLTNAGELCVQCIWWVACALTQPIFFDSHAFCKMSTT